MTLKRPRAILFDWDNTLVDTWPVIHSSLEKTMLALGREPWSMDEVRRKVRRSLRDSFPEVFGEGWEKARELYYGHFRGQHLEKLTPIDEAERMLGHLLDKDIHIAVVSNKTGQYLREEVSHLGWDKYFSKVIGALDTPRDKPAIDPVLAALKDSGVEAGPDVWFIGDSDIDVECALKAGCIPIFFGENLHESDEIVKQAHAHMRDHADLIDLFTRTL